MTLKGAIKSAIRWAGYDISRFAPTSHPIARKRQMFNTLGVDAVLDIGANTGQFARWIRSELGYKGQILSFEPLSSAFAQLQEDAKHDPMWEVFNYGIGDENAIQSINIAKNSFSSSMLEMLPAHLISAPESEYVGAEPISVKTLDSIFADVCKTASRIYMKIDTQGFERNVISGAQESLRRIDTVQIEMSLLPLYQGELLFNDMCTLMTTKGFTLMRIENGLTDPASGQLLQVDGIFHRLEKPAST